MIAALATFLATYVLGSVSFAWLVGRFFLPSVDLTRTNLDIPENQGVSINYSGVSATSVGVRLGPKWGATVGVLDMLKGFLPVFIMLMLGQDASLLLIAATGLMVGHNWPIFHRFRGGKGQSVFLGSLLAIAPMAPLVCLPVGLLFGLFVVRDLAVAYNSGQYLLIGWFLIFAQWPEMWFAIAANTLYTIAGWNEVRQYMHLKRTGQIAPVTNWRDVMRGHPVLKAGRKPRQ